MRPYKKSAVSLFRTCSISFGSIGNVNVLLFPGLRTAMLLEYRFRESCHKQGIHLSFQAPMCAGCIEDEGLKAMAAWRRAIELSLGDADVEGLRSIAQSRTEPASRVERARIVLAYREDPSFFALGRALG